MCPSEKDRHTPASKTVSKCPDADYTQRKQKGNRYQSGTEVTHRTGYAELFSSRISYII